MIYQIYYIFLNNYKDIHGSLTLGRFVLRIGLIFNGPKKLELVKPITIFSQVEV